MQLHSQKHWFSVTQKLEDEETWSLMALGLLARMSSSPEQWTNNPDLGNAVRSVLARAPESIFIKGQEFEKRIQHLIQHTEELTQEIESDIDDLLDD